MRKIILKKSIEDIEPLRNLLEQIKQSDPKVNVSGLVGASRSYLASLLFARMEQTLLVVCPEEKEAAAMARDMILFLGEDNVIYYPPLDFRAVDMFTLQRQEELIRLEVLAKLQINTQTVVVTSVIALMQKVMPFAQFNAYLQIISTGDTLEREDLGENLLSGGYKRVSLVETAGEFSIRGNIIDIFPPTEKNPLRLEMSSDEIESIRTFDSISQRSVETVNAFVISPASEVIITLPGLELATRNIKRRADDLSLSREIRNRLVETLQNNPANSINPVFLPLFYEAYDNSGESPQNKLSNFLEYLPKNTLVVLDDPLAISQTAPGIEQNIDKLMFKAKNNGKFYLEKESAYIDLTIILAGLERFGQISLTALQLDEAVDNASGAVVFETNQNLQREEPQAGEIKEEALLRQTAGMIKLLLSSEMLIVFMCPTREDLNRMQHLLSGYDLPVQVSPSPDLLLDFIHKWNGLPQLILWEGKISSSFIFPAMKLAVLSEEEIFVKKVIRRRTRQTLEGTFLKSFGELKEGDFVVHTDFGIGAYRGLKKISVGKIENDFLVIEYFDGDKLYLPVNTMEKIQRYLGPDGYVPKIDKMGGASWDAVKERVKKSVREVAEDLVAIYAAREVMERKSFAPPDRIYEEFCSTFEFEETPDQAKAIEDVHLDMDDVKPMDRLICGDAGFGKTEVAIRSAFRAVMDGKQVAVLVPTTILAEQHYQTMASRLSDFPIRVEVLNRFKSTAEQKKIVQDLKSQKIDIVVGTHRLISKDVEFKELGLVIIDEEQRFGVAHKEKLKKCAPLLMC